MLTAKPKEIKFYKDKGYLLPEEKVFSNDKFANLVVICEELLANKGQKRADELDTPHFVKPELFDYLMSGEVLNVVESMIGPNIGLWSSHLICKEPYTGRRTPWHEDSAYWNGRFDRFDKIVTLWLAIDRSSLENGCMGVVPESHHNGFSDYANISGEDATFTEEISSTVIDENKVVWFEREPGQCSLHDSRIIHGAKANTSPHRRCGYTMRYFSLEMQLNPDHPGNKTHKVYHCRGENLASNPLIYR